MYIFKLLKKSKQEKKYIAFTFDDGPSKEYTNKILKILKRNNAKATFFVLGTRALENVHLLEQIIKNDCEIGNHTYNHELTIEDKESEIIDSIRKAQNIIYSHTNISPRFLRLPGGHVLDDVDTIKSMGLCYIGWNVESGDWFSENPDDIYMNTKREIQEGCIVIFHDIYDRSVKALDKLLKDLKKEGYVATTVSELFKHYDVKLEAGKVYKGVNIHE